MTRDDLIDAVIRLSPSLPGARRLEPSMFDHVPHEELQATFDLLSRVDADRRSRAQAPDPGQSRRLNELRVERDAIVARMRSRLDTQSTARAQDR